MTVVTESKLENLLHARKYIDSDWSDLNHLFGDFDLNHFLLNYFDLIYKPHFSMWFVILI